MKLLANKQIPHPAILCFWLFCTLHLIFWVSVHTYIYKNPPIDALESVAWGNMWLFGYEKHPPLAAWLAAGITHILGMYGYALYLLSQICIVICFYYVWRLAQSILSQWHALIAVMLLEGINYYNLQAASFDPNILMLPLWAGIMWYFYQAALHDRWRDWILLAIFTGLSMLAKYQSALLIIILFSFTLRQLQTRKFFYRSKFYIAALIAVIIFLPNLIWLALHRFDAVYYAVGEMQQSTQLPTWLERIWRPAQFALEQLGAIAPMFLLVTPFYFQNDNRAEKMLIDPFTKSFLFWMAWLPLLITISAAVILNMHLVSRWGFPFFSVVGIYFIAKWQPNITKHSLCWFFLIMVIFVLTCAIGQSYLYRVKSTKMHHSALTAIYPGRNIANTLTNEWHQRYHSKLEIVSAEHNVSVNIAAFSVDQPKPLFNFDFEQSPWVTREELKKYGAVFVIPLDSELDNAWITTIKKEYPQLQNPSIQCFTYQNHPEIPPVRLWVAWLAPLN